MSSTPWQQQKQSRGVAYRWLLGCTTTKLLAHYIIIWKVFQQLNLSSINLLINSTYSPWEHPCWQESRPSGMGSEAGRGNMECRTPLVPVLTCRIKQGSKSSFPQLPSQKFDHACHLTGHCPNTSCSAARAWKWPSQHQEMTHPIDFLSSLDIDTKRYHLNKSALLNTIFARLFLTIPNHHS